MKKNNKITFNQLDSIFVNVVEESISEMQFTTSEKIVNQRIAILQEYVIFFRKYKLKAIEENMEYEANSLLYIQCTLQSIYSVFNTFKLIRNNSNLEAWNSLIDAHEYLDIATKARLTISKTISINKNNGIFEIKRRIEKIEEGLFPSQKIYNSAALIESLGYCSICGCEFIDCNHIEGEIYVGQYCRRKKRKILSIDHIALVKNPRDRRCINTSKHNSKGISIDIFSGEPLEKQLKENQFSGLAFYAKQLDLD